MSEPDFSNARVRDRVWDLFLGTEQEVVEHRDIRGEMCISGYGPLGNGKQNGVQRFYWSRPAITGGCEPPKRMAKKTIEVDIWRRPNGQLTSEVRGNPLGDLWTLLKTIETEIEVEE